MNQAEAIITGIFAVLILGLLFKDSSHVQDVFGGINKVLSTLESAG